MPILDLQRRQTEVGRIRLGTSKTAVSKRTGKEYQEPVKLETFRFTSPSHALIEQVAALYGGEPGQWQPQGGGAVQWEVITPARSLAVVVPPNSVSQWYESWTGGHCTRRCNGQTEVLTDKPCLCDPDPGERECKPTTRIALMLAEVPGIGVWRLETHGFYAATELPAVAELLAGAGGYVAARLEVEERSAKRPKERGDGYETRRWMVPVLHVDAAPAQLLALTGGPQRQAIEANGTRKTTEQYIALARMATNRETVRGLWKQAMADDVMTEQLAELLQRRAAELDVADAAGEPTPPPTHVEGEVEPDRNGVWMEILGLAAGHGWDTARTSQEVREYTGNSPEECTGWELAAFRDRVKTGQVTV